jgi:hypothetical protein
MVRFINDSREVDKSSTKPLLVIGAGLPRAATSSMQDAFEELGLGPCLHMAHILPHADRAAALMAGMKEQDTARRQKIVHELVDGYQSVSDLPVVFFTPDFMDMFPDAKIVLNGRPSPEIWAKSCNESLGFFFTWQFACIGFLWKVDRLWYQINMECRRWGKRTFDSENLISAEVYRDYYASVREEAAKRGREVLEFKAEDGWEPLCKFLGKPVPDKPFPRSNEKSVFRIVKLIIIARGLAAWTALGGILWLGWRHRGVAGAVLGRLFGRVFGRG